MAAKTITLRSGRVLSANDGIIGLGPDLVLKEGYDGPLEWEDMEEPFTESERLEIASLMIDRWVQWAPVPKTFRQSLIDRGIWFVDGER